VEENLRLWADTVVPSNTALTREDEAARARARAEARREGDAWEGRRAEEQDQERAGEAVEQLAAMAQAKMDGEMERTPPPPPPHFSSGPLLP
jgi:hypothetical protein